MRKILIFMCAGILVPGVAGAKDKENILSVISYNIRLATPADGDNQWENRKHSTLAMLDATEPDLIGMQEVLSGQMEYLKANLKDYTILGVGRDDGKNKGEIMPVLFKTERFEMLDNGTFWLSETPDEVSRGWDAACNRTVTWVRLKDNRSGKTICFFNTHFDHRGKQARMESSNLILHKIKEIAGKKDAIVLTGDFNIEPNDPAIAPLFKKLYSARDKATISDRHATFNGWGQPGKDNIIDYIFCRGAKPIIYKTITNGYGSKYISDHYPISSIIKLK